MLIWPLWSFHWSWVLVGGRFSSTKSQIHKYKNTKECKYKNIRWPSTKSKILKYQNWEYKKITKWPPLKQITALASTSQSMGHQRTGANPQFTSQSFDNITQTHNLYGFWIIWPQQLAICLVQERAVTDLRMTAGLLCHCFRSSKLRSSVGWKPLKLIQSKSHERAMGWRKLVSGAPGGKILIRFLCQLPLHSNSSRFFALLLVSFVYLTLFQSLTENSCDTI